MTTPAPATVSSKELAIPLMQVVATRIGSQAVANGLRWEARPDRNPPAVVIMRRGKKIPGVSNVVAVISADPNSAYGDLYASWQPVLERWKAEKEAANNGRVSHDGLGFGGTPDA